MSGLAEHTDAQLVAGVLAGDRAAFAAIYDRYADRLHDFCHSVLRDRDEAADAVQDTFVLVAQRLAQLNDPDRLRPWLYAVARSVALRRVRVRRRVVLDEVEDMADTDPGPDRAAEQVALRELVWSAAAGLSERDRALLDLHVRQGLDGAELGEAMGVSAGHAYVLLSRLRDQVERSLGALLIARQGRRDCVELDALLANWDGRYSPLMRKRVARHVDACEVCADRRRIMVSPFALLAAVPLLPAPLWLRDRVMDQVQLASFAGELPADDAPEGGPLDDFFYDDEDDYDDEDLDGAAETEKGVAPVSAVAASRVPPTRQRTRVAAVAAAVLALLVVAGGAAYLRNSPVPGEPLGLDLPIAPVPPTINSTTSSGNTSPTTTTTSVEPIAEPPDDDTGEPVDDDIPDDPTTTTTTRRVAPPDPPDPPDPPRDGNPPVISGATAANPRINVVTCREPFSSPASATVTDDRALGSVTLSWTGAGTGSVAMTQDGDQWFGTIGTFTQPGSVEWTVTAVDAAGNQAPPAGGKITVLPCPN